MRHETPSRRSATSSNDPNVWILSAVGAAPGDVVASVREALPVLLESISMGLDVATATVVLVFGVLQWRLCRVTIREMSVTTAAVAVPLLLARLLV